MLLFQDKEITKHGLVEVRLELQYPKLYLDAYIEIITEKNKIIRNAITLRPDALRTRILRIPKGAKEITLLPKRYDGKIEFKQKELIKFIFPITLWSIYCRLKHHKLKFHLPMSKLWRTYSQTFNIKMGIKNYSSWTKLKEPYLIEKTINSASQEKKLNLVIFSLADKPETTLFNQVNADQALEIFDLTNRNIETIERIERIVKNKENENFLLLFNTDKIHAKAIDLITTNTTKLKNSDLIYTDEDRITNGHRHSPQFKPEWNPELWEDSKYIGRTVIFKAKFLKGINWQNFIPTVDTISELIKSHNPRQLNIGHIPHICFHNQLPITKEKEVVTSVTKIIRNKTPQLINQAYSAELLIPTKDKVDILKACINSILEKTSYKNFRITILDNNSSEPESLLYLKQISVDPRIRVLKYPYPFNYSAINNFGAKQSDADALVLVNNDIEVISPNWLEEMLSIAMKTDIGCVGAKLYYPNGWIQHAGVILGIGDVAGHSHRFYPEKSSGYMNRLAHCQQVSAVTAACLAIKRSIWNEVNGLDEKNLTVAYNDVDFCLRVQELGYRNIWTPYAELTHHESISRGADNTPKKKKRYIAEVAYMKKRWAQELKQDPFYHPAFSRTKEDFSLQF